MCFACGWDGFVVNLKVGEKSASFVLVSVVSDRCVSLYGWCFVVFVQFGFLNC